jgi:glucose-1-phosphate cytidylyltransferase
VRTVILAGGLGTRLQEETTVKPKPMVEIGGRPILWHIMKTFGHFGFKEFVVALGYRGEVIKRYFLDYRQHATGGRLRRLKGWLSGETFMMTYGDGVANLDIRELLRFHRRHGRLATITAVRPPSRFGGLKLAGDEVVDFEEKPQIGEGWINGGFFVLEPAVLDLIDSDDVLFEGAPLERLAAEQQLVAYRHEGFWQCMDTLRDVRLLEGLWQQGNAPWNVWQ